MGAPRCPYPSPLLVLLGWRRLLLLLLRALLPRLVGLVVRVVCGVPRIVLRLPILSFPPLIIVNWSFHYVSSKWLVCPCPCPCPCSCSCPWSPSGACGGRVVLVVVGVGASALSAQRSRLGRREERFLERSDVLHDVGGHLLEGRPETHGEGDAPSAGEPVVVDLLQAVWSMPLALR